MFLMLCIKQQCGPSLLRKPSQWDPPCTPAIWHASQSKSRGTSHLQATIRVSCAQSSPLMVLLLHVASLNKKGRRSQLWIETGLLRNALLVNKKKSGSCRCVMTSPVSPTGAATQQGILQRQHFGCRALLGRFLVGRVSLDARLTLSRKIPEGLPESYDCVISLLAPSQRYNTIKEEEACQL